MAHTPGALSKKDAFLMLFGVMGPVTRSRWPQLSENGPVLRDPMFNDKYDGLDMREAFALSKAGSAYRRGTAIIDAGPQVRASQQSKLTYWDLRVWQRQVWMVLQSWQANDAGFIFWVHDNGGNGKTRLAQAIYDTGRALVLDHNTTIGDAAMAFKQHKASTSEWPAIVVFDLPKGAGKESIRCVAALFWGL